MKTIKEVLDFSKNLTDYNHYNFERKIELNHMRDFLIDFWSNFDYYDENSTHKNFWVF